MFEYWVIYRFRSKVQTLPYTHPVHHLPVEIGYGWDVPVFFVRWVSGPYSVTRVPSVSEPFPIFTLRQKLEDAQGIKKGWFSLLSR